MAATAPADEAPGGLEGRAVDGTTVKSLLEDMHQKMQFLCEELSLGRGPAEAEGPARAILRSCATLRTVSQDSSEPNSARASECPQLPQSRLISGALSVFGESEGRSLPARSRAHSEHEKISRALFDGAHVDPLAARVAQLEETLSREEPVLQRFQSELRANFAEELEAVRAQLLREFREEVQAQKEWAMAELQSAKKALRERFSSLPSHRSSERFRICWEEASRGVAQGDMALERLEVLAADLRRLTSEVRAQAELLDHVRQLTDSLLPAAEEPRTCDFQDAAKPLLTNDDGWERGLGRKWGLQLQGKEEAFGAAQADPVPQPAGNGACATWTTPRGGRRGK